MFQISSLFYICCRWWEKFDRTLITNGFLSDYVRIKSLDLVEHMKCLSQLVMNEQQINIWFENDPIELLEDSYFLIRIFQKCIKEVNVH